MGTPLRDVQSSSNDSVLLGIWGSDVDAFGDDFTRRALSVQRWIECGGLFLFDSNLERRHQRIKIV